MDQPASPGADLWQEAAAGVQSWLDADLRAEAYEVFVAEAARCRLVDRVGAARVALRCGVVLEGELVPDSDDAVDEHLVLRGAGDVTRLVPVSAVVSRPGFPARPAARGERRASIPHVVAARGLVGGRAGAPARRLGDAGSSADSATWVPITSSSWTATSGRSCR